MIKRFREISQKVKASFEKEEKCLVFLQKFSKATAEFSEKLKGLSIEIEEKGVLAEDAERSLKSSRGTARSPTDFPETPPLVGQLKAFFWDLSIFIQRPFQELAVESTHEIFKLNESRESIDFLDQQVQQKMNLIKNMQSTLSMEHEEIQNKFFKETLDHFDSELLGEKTTLMFSKKTQKESTITLRKSLQQKFEDCNQEAEKLIENAMEKLYLIESSTRKSIESHFCSLLKQEQTVLNDFFKSYLDFSTRMTIETPGFVLSPQKLKESMDSSLVLSPNENLMSSRESQNEDKKKANCVSLDVKSNTTEGRRLKENREKALGVFKQIGEAKENGCGLGFRSPANLKKQQRGIINDTPIPKRNELKERGFQLVKET